VTTEAGLVAQLERKHALRLADTHRAFVCETSHPALVSHCICCDQAAKPFTVRYEAVNAMLLNEFLKAHRKLEQQQTTIERQQKQIEALTATVQKVSKQIETNKPALQVAANNQ
jgi:hypothetical protein